MKNKHEGCTRKFTHLSRAWYGEACLRDRLAGCVDEITIGMYDLTGGGTSGEFAIRWIELGGENVPRLEAFSDSWDALGQFRDLLAELARLDSTNPTPSKICEVLVSLGIEDATETKQP